MTTAEAEALRVKWKLCEHPNQELEASDGGYLTGNYHCIECGEPIIKL